MQKSYSIVSNSREYVLLLALLLGFMSFGNFGITNYYGMSIPFEVFSICLASIGALSGLSIKRNQVTFLLAFLSLVFLYSFGLTLFVSKAYIIRGMGIALFGLIVLSIPDASIIRLAKGLFYCSFILCCLVLISYLLYTSNIFDYKDSTASAYDSTFLFDPVYPANLADLFSMVSGGSGFVFLDGLFRMKGYSTEPSSTIVHYFVP